MGAETALAGQDVCRFDWLQAEEKRLKIKIAEMAIQEVQLRIKALSEDMRRTEELHRLRLARTAAGNRQTFE